MGDHVCKVFDVLRHGERSVGAHSLPRLKHLERVGKRLSEQARASWSTRTTVDDYHRPAVGTVSLDWDELLFVLHRSRRPTDRALSCVAQAADDR